MSYINREELLAKIKQVEDERSQNGTPEEAELARSFREYVEFGLPEMEPVRHGHWKALRGDWDGLYECQECGNRLGTPYYYCPVCGVKMDCVDGGAEAND